MTVFKYQLQAEDNCIDMPCGAKVLSTGLQDGNLMLWALVDPSQPMTPRYFAVHGTGHLVAYPTSAQFIGTVVCMNDALVLHVFEIPDEKSST